MPLLPRTLVIAAALIAPAAAFTAACGDADSPAPKTAAEDPAPDTRVPASTTTAARPTLAEQLREVVRAGSPGAIALVNDGHRVRLHAEGVADTR
jgi:hypothetical protein